MSWYIVECPAFGCQRLGKIKQLGKISSTVIKPQNKDVKNPQCPEKTHPGIVGFF